MGQVSSIYAFNTALDLMCAAVVLVLVVVMRQQSRYMKSKTKFLFVLVSEFFLLSVLADAGTFWWAERAYESVAFHISLIVDFEMLQVTFALLHMYVIDYFSEQARFPKWFRYIGIPIFFLEGIAWAISMTTGWFYVIGPEGYHTTDVYVWLNIPSVLVFVVDIICIIAQRKKIKRDDMVSWIIYLILASLGLYLEIIAKVPVAYVAITFMILIIYLKLELQRELVIAKQEAELADERTKIALSQIRPHFIYNCLAVIQVLCKTDPEKAVETIKRFSNFLRGSLDAMDKKELVPFEEELYILNSYLYLEKIRFQEKLHLEKEIETSDFFLPALTVQPIVENAIKHGIRGKTSGGTIKIHVYETLLEYVIAVEDDGVGFDKETVENDGVNHVGVKNVETRLDNMCKGSLVINSTVGIGTRAEIHIPKQSR